MRCLFLDLASHNGVIACVDSVQTVFVQEADHRIGDHELLPLIEQALAGAGWSYGDLTHMACVTGPGGFTSLRVGVTCANVLAHELKIPLGGVHLSDVYAARIGGGVWGVGGGALWLHSTKKDQLFVRGGKWKEATLISMDVFCTEHRSHGIWMGELIPEQRVVMERLGMQEATLKPVSAVLPAVLSAVSFGNVSLEPWYGRGW